MYFLRICMLILLLLWPLEEQLNIIHVQTTPPPSSKVVSGLVLEAFPRMAVPRGKYNRRIRSSEIPKRLFEILKVIRNNVSDGASSIESHMPLKGADVFVDSDLLPAP